MDVQESCIEYYAGVSKYVALASQADRVLRQAQSYGPGSSIGIRFGAMSSLHHVPGIYSPIVSLTDA